MHLVVFRTKYGDMYLMSEDREKIFAKVLAERIADGYWYEDEQEAYNALLAGKAYSFLSMRQDCEYEGFEEIIPEVV